MPIHGYPGNVITANPTAPTSSVASGVWTTEQQLIAKAAGNWPFTIPTQQISRSLRFNSADSAYLNRTPASAGNRKTWTWSAWVKRSALGTVQGIFDAYSGSSDFATAFFNTDNTIYFYSCSNSGSFIDYDFTTTALFRDVGAWYHIVLVLNTVSATQADRFIVYVNGVRQTGTNPSGAFDLNVETYINSTVSHRLGSRTDGSYYSNGYMAEVNFIDGQALTPSSFGRTNSNTGVWEPIAYTGTYGTNGFYLNFSDNSGTTSTTLGKDSSGNGNNWTPNNFSVTAGAGNDSLVDTPTAYGTDTGVGGEVRGNYATLNPLDVSANTLSNGNLDITYATNSDTNRGGTIAVSTGKWYFEATVQAVGGIYAIIGVTSGVATATALGTSAYQYSYISSTGNKFNNGSSTAYGNTYTTGDVIGVALDMDNGKVWFSKNGTFQASGDPAAGTNQAFSGLSGSFSPAINARSNSIVNLNCGQRAFAYTAPSGFKALCTQNLPTPTIGATSTTQANDYFNVGLWTSNSSASNIAVTGIGFQPDFFWGKLRSAATSHRLIDSIRGVTKTLYSNATNAEGTESDAFASFNADGFTIGQDTTGGGLNYLTNTGVGWVWKGGGTGVSNTAGTITSTVSASTTSGFSIVTYTGNGSGGATVGHGLGASPSWIIIKSRSNATNWMVWTDKLTTNYALEGLNTTGAEVSGGSPSKYIRAVSSTTFTIGTDISVNQSASYTYVAYCFAPVAGYSAFGSYTGNGSNDGVFVYTGFRPRWILVKRTDSTSGWHLYDTARDTYNAATKRLQPDLSNAENTANGIIDILSNGWKFRNTNTDWDASGGTYIYMAFAESPFKYSLAR